MTQQLPLTLPLNHAATLTDFCWHQNTLLQQQLTYMLSGQGEQLLYLWGTHGSGKSHVLQACCQTNIHSSMYLPLTTLNEYGPHVLEGIEQQKLLAIDDIDAIAGQPLWEEALFHLYNTIRDQGHGCLIISGSSAPMNMPLQLKDLRSRLSGGLVMQLHELSDTDKIHTLQGQAAKRGLELSMPVGRFILHRCARNMHDLLRLLNQLDEASLIAQRKITIPFVKQTLKI